MNLGIVKKNSWNITNPLKKITASCGKLFKMFLRQVIIFYR